MEEKDTKPAQSESATREEQILADWERNDIFKKTLQKDAPEGEFVFYEGPPTANGKPGIHHLISRAFKDVIPRYKTMRGFHVRRKAGWDTHGLPVEIEVEKQLGLTSKRQIEEYGIAAFNEKCKESVWKYVSEWRDFTRRIGYWVDLDDAYVTYYPRYIESLWHIVKEIHGKGHLYKDYKVVPWCPRCGTALSSHELAQGYADVTDTSVFVKFKVVGAENMYLLAWTTTPWTLPGNVALAVGENIEYVKVQKGEEIWWLAKERATSVTPEAEVLETVSGSALVGLQYEPLFPFLSDTVPASEKEKMQNAFRVHPASFVSTADGTGIVHTAVMYGAEDFDLGNEVGLPKHHLVGEDGRFTKDVPPYAGVFVKDADKPILEDLDSRGLLFKTEPVTHTYPFCWRCKSPLIYYARDSWYIRMSALRDALVAENKKINWVPEYIQEGRFGEWLREIKDWAISRDRYWGTPLPVWRCSACGKEEVIGSLDELSKKQRRSKNRYIILRHGESISNETNTMSGEPGDAEDKLTEKGKKEAAEAAKHLSKEKIDLIVTSNFTRTRETADIVAAATGADVVVDEALHEIGMGPLDGKSFYEAGLFYTGEDWYTKRPDGGESHQDVYRRVARFLFDLDARYEGKTILVVTHGAPAQMLFAVASRTKSEELAQHFKLFKETAEFHELTFSPYPHNEVFELDLHKPHIDAVVVPCPLCDVPMNRTPEVMDVWFDSGAMPFAQDHYPFENKDWIDSVGYPAGYISEAIDQTRGWFYTLHAIGVLLGRGRAYENVICLGHILDAKGKKMSKSIGNVINPWDAMAKYGVDVLRFWMYSVNQPGDAKNFDEKSVDEVVKKVFTILRNVVTFYGMYGSAADPSVDPRKSEHALDQWILAKLDVLSRDVSLGLDAYHIFEPTRAIRDFIQDLSTWYVRRSRDRFKEGGRDASFAVATLGFVLRELSKLMAPFTPFFAEEIYKASGGALESVHLESWSALQKPDEDALADMDAVRSVVSLALEARMNAGVKVRQPLAKLSIRNPKSPIAKNEQLITLIKEEVNVKEVVFSDGAGWEVELDTVITPELRSEGYLRDVTRTVQDLRKKARLSPGEGAALRVSGNDAGVAFVKSIEADIKRTASITEVRYEQSIEGENLTLEELSITLGLA